MLLSMYMYVDLNVFLLIIDFIMYINTAVNENVNGYFEDFLRVFASTKINDQMPFLVCLNFS